MAFADLDNDGDYDFFANDHYGNMNYFENTSNHIFDDPIDNPFGLSSSYESWGISPRFVDIDNDGDLDLMIGESYYYYNGRVRFHENIGDANTPAFTDGYEINPFGLYPMGEYGSIGMADVDDDGDMDILMSSTHHNIAVSEGNMYFFENIGTASSPEFNYPITNFSGLRSLGELSFVELVNIDADNDIDVFAGQMMSDITFFENNVYGIGTTDFTLNEDIAVYPNPVEDVLQIQTEKIIQKVTVYNMLRQDILTPNVIENQLPLNELTLGVYVVKIVFEDGTMSSAKVQKL